MPRTRTENENDTAKRITENEAATEALKRRKQAEFDERTKGGE